MAALIDTDYLRATFNIDKSVVDSRLDPYVAIASRRLNAWVGDTNYGDGTIADELQLAEAMLAMHFVTLNLNVNIRPKGLVRREVVEGNVTVEYMSPSDTQATATSFLDQAEEMVRAWRVDSDLPPVASVATNDDCCLSSIDTSCEAVTRSYC